MWLHLSWKPLTQCIPQNLRNNITRHPIKTGFNAYHQSAYSYHKNSEKDTP